MRCACGEPLHYSDPNHEAAVTQLVEELGECVKVSTPDGSWMVPRHYIALHGIKADNLFLTAAVYGFEEVE